MSAPKIRLPSTYLVNVDLTLGFAGGLYALSLGVAIQYGWSVGSATGIATAGILIALIILTKFFGL
jgi:hypothetical protein